jgi:hypothetical protein
VPWAIATSGRRERAGLALEILGIAADVAVARALGVGLLSGGYGQEELERAGAYRVYEDPADLLRYLDEVGVRTSE